MARHAAYRSMRIDDVASIDMIAPALLPHVEIRDKARHALRKSQDAAYVDDGSAAGVTAAIMICCARFVVEMVVCRYAILLRYTDTMMPYICARMQHDTPGAYGAPGRCL